MTNVRNSVLREKRQTVVTDSEFAEAMQQADRIQNEFLRLRASALLCLLRLTGKRRGEAAILPLGNVKTEDNFLKITFILEKKRKENVLQKLATKSIPLSDPLTKPVVQYLDYLNRQEPKPKWFLPQAVSVFGNVTAINAEAHVSGRQVFNIARGCSKSVWPHLFRETVASDIIREDSSIIAAFKVQRRLDLEDFRTGFRYLKRFAEDVILKQEQQTVNGFRQT